METIAPGSALVGNYVLVLAVRQLLIYLGWLLLAGLAGAGACWCCGHGATATWGRAQAARLAWREARQAVRHDAVSAEAQRGILAIEQYLVVQSVVPEQSIVSEPQPAEDDEPG